MPDRSVLAGGVERLQHHQHAPGVLGREARLVLGQKLDALAEDLLPLLLLLDPTLEAGIEVLIEAHLGARLDPERRDEVFDPPAALLVHTAINDRMASRSHHPNQVKPEPRRTGEGATFRITLLRSALRG